MLLKGRNPPQPLLNPSAGSACVCNCNPSQPLPWIRLCLQLQSPLTPPLDPPVLTIASPSTPQLDPPVLAIAILINASPGSACARNCNPPQPLPWIRVCLQLQSPSTPPLDPRVLTIAIPLNPSPGSACACLRIFVNYTLSGLHRNYCPSYG